MKDSDGNFMNEMFLRMILLCADCTLCLLMTLGARPSITSFFVNPLFSESVCTSTFSGWSMTESFSALLLDGSCWLTCPALDLDTTTESGQTRSEQHSSTFSSLQPDGILVYVGHLKGLK